MKNDKSNVFRITVSGFLLLIFLVAVATFFSIEKKKKDLVEVMLDTPEYQPAGEMTASSTISEKPKPESKPEEEVVISEEVTPGNILLAINAERVKLGLTPLKRNTRLEEAAERKLNDIYSNNYFAHVSPSGISYADFIKMAGYDYVFAGENLAACCRSKQTVSSTVSAWMASPTHYVNIVGIFYTESGVAVRDGFPCNDVETGAPRTCLIVVQEFGTEK